MKVVNLSEKNSILNQYLKEIRSTRIQKDPLRFRRNIERIGEIMALEVSRTLNYKEEKVETPLGSANVNVISDKIVLGTILRAGLPLHQGFLNMFDKAEKKKVCMIPLANVDEGAVMHVASDYIYTSKTIILYFKDMLDNINIGDRVALIIDGIVYL